MESPFSRVATAAMLAAAVIVLAAAPAIAGFQRTKVAVLDFELQGTGFETEDMGSIVAEWFITALVREGRFDVVERALLRRIIDEQQLVMSGLIDQSSATNLGNLLGVNIIISGSVLKLGNVLEVNARIIDVESASIIAAENVKSTTSQSLQSLIVRMSEKIIENFPLKGYVVARDGNVVTLDLGATAGVRVGMEFLIYKEGKTIRHPMTGEVLDVEEIETGSVEITSVSAKISRSVVVGETAGGSIIYGQLVKSIPAPLKPLQDVPVYVGPATTRQSTTGSVQPLNPASPSGNANYINKLTSGSANDKKWAARKIFDNRIYDVEVLDVVEQEVLAGYRISDDNYQHVDSMAWLVKALGQSGNPKYLQTLKLVKKKAKHRKIQGHAKQALKTYY